MTPPAQPPGSVHADELLTLKELQRRLGWGEHSVRKARQAGLRLVRFGNKKYCLGRDLLAFFDGLESAHEGRTRV